MMSRGVTCMVLSERMSCFMAGLQKYLRPFLVMSAPVINSYTRLVKGAWAPTSATWGVDNRTTALRAIPGNEKSQRIEFREELPYNETGKLLRRQVRAELAD